MTDKEIHSSLVQFVRKATTIPVVIKDAQSGDEPAEPFVMVAYTGSDEVRDWPGTDHESEEVDGNDPTQGVRVTPVIETEWRFSVHAFGSPADKMPTDILRPIRSAALLNQMMEPMFPSLVVHDCSQIRNIPERTDTGYKQRAQMDVFVRGLARDGHVIDTIETYQFNFTRSPDVWI